ncbi:MAG TPA: protease HtpX, partial [Candidatus Dormibacteraeota bacterium]|nr:protease HtpX [Candidatus Dormibacteraeota bacterium]
MNRVKTAMLLATLTALLIWVGQALGGQQGLVMGLGFAIIMNVGSYWYSDKIVLRMYGAQEVDEAQAPELYSIVRNLAQAAQ